MAVDLQDPRQLGRDLDHDLPEHLGELRQALVALRLQPVGGGGEQHLGLEDEAVADDGEVAPLAQHLAEPAEELGAVGGELLDLGGERHVEALAEVGDGDLLLLALELRGLQGLFDAG